ncbi:MAG: rane protein insertase YidC [Bacteroidota bacterium]
MNLDRNTIIGLVLMLLLGLGFSWYTAPTEEEIAAEKKQATADSIAALQPKAPEVKTAPMVVPDSLLQDSAYMAQKAAEQQSKYGVFGSAAIGNNTDVVLENDKIRTVLHTKGGLFYSVTLKDGYTRYSDKKAIELWDEKLSQMILQWNLSGKGEMRSSDFYFIPSAAAVDASSSKGTLSMKLPTSDPSKYLELVYTLEPGAYAVACKVNIVGLGNEMELGSRSVMLDWSAVGLANEKGIQAERGKSSVYFREMEEDRDYLKESGDDSGESEKKVNWVAFKQDYFSAAVISDQGFGEKVAMDVKVPTDSTHTKAYHARMALPITSAATTSTDVRFFFGPNDFNILKAQNVEEFDRIIDYGWSIIGLVNKYAIRPLFWFFSSFIGSLGLIILIVTVIIKMVLFPVTWKNFLSGAKMRVLKPEIDEINKKYEGKDAAMEKQQAIMALYRQTGVNPFAGCIPVLLQMPILYAMFRFFPAEIVLRGESFLWADDLAAYDSIFNLGFNIPFYGAHVSGFTLLMVASTFIYTRMSMQATPQTTQPGMPNMKVMMNIFTFMMLFFFNSMPAGLTMYYFTANVISIGQMVVIKKYFINEDEIRAKIDENKKKPKKKSSFSQRLEDMQKEQQRKLAEQKSKLK